MLRCVCVCERCRRVSMLTADILEGKGHSKCYCSDQTPPPPGTMCLIGSEPSPSRCVCSWARSLPSVLPPPRRTGEQLTEAVPSGAHTGRTINTHCTHNQHTLPAQSTHTNTHATHTQHRLNTLHAQSTHTHTRNTHSEHTLNTH